LNDIISVPNFMKIYQAVQKLLVRDTDGQIGDLISILSFLESKLKRRKNELTPLMSKGARNYYSRNRTLNFR
jgi:hypothetical protein